MLQSVRNFLKTQPIILAPIVKMYGLRLAKYNCSLHLDSTKTKLAVRKGSREIHISFENNHFSSDIAREFDDLFEAVVPEKSGKKLIADFSKPKQHEIPGLGKKFVFTFIPETKCTNAAYLKALQPKPGDVIIDAGAYCGLTAYEFSRAVGPDGKVIAIEADPNNYAVLCENIKNNGATNITPVNAALWKEMGTLQFQAEGSMGSTVSAKGDRHNKTVDVQALTFDAICESFDLNKVDHVKMDIEGAEYDVLPASGEFISKFKPDFIVEVHSIDKGPSDVPRLAAFFATLGYSRAFIQQSNSDIDPLVHFSPVQ
jgi:FkbM family methyltransferase